MRVQIILALGDTAIFIFFAAAGRASHDLPPGESPVLTLLGVAAPSDNVFQKLISLMGTSILHYLALSNL